MQKIAVFDNLKSILLNLSHSLAQPDGHTHTHARTHAHTHTTVQLQVNKYNTNCNTPNSKGTLRLIYKDSLVIWSFSSVNTSVR